MAYHPAEFARRGYRLLQQISKDFYTHKDDIILMKKLYKQYDEEVKKLYQTRLDWSDKDYLIKNVESFIIGSIASMVIVLAVVLMLEQLNILYLASLSVTLKIYLGISLGGGVAWMFINGPKKLQEQERENATLMALYDSASQLYKKYEALKKVYRRKMLEPGERIGELPMELSGAISDLSMTDDDGIPDDLNVKNEGKKKKAKRKWGLSDAEREARRNILSLRFLMKVAKMKEDVVEEKEYEKPLVLIMEPDAGSAERYAEFLKDQFEVIWFQNMADLSAHEFERNPRIIISEAEFPEAEYLAVPEALSERFDMREAYFIINTKEDDLTGLLKARDLLAVDYWIKQYDSEDELIIRGREIIGKLNGYISTARSSFIRQLERRIRRKQFQDVVVEDDESQKDTVVMMITTDFLLSGYLGDELATYNVVALSVSNPQKIFGTAIAAKPQLIILDDNIAEDGASNICKMLNIRLPDSEIVLVVKNNAKMESDIKIKELNVLKKFTRPYMSSEILEYIVSHLNLRRKETEPEPVQKNVEKL